jgi:hypothetical protein
VAVEASPYRAPTTGPVERLRFHPGLSLRVVLVIAFIGLFPAGLQLFLWSRVVTIDCTRAVAGGEEVRCQVDERAIAIGSTRTVIVAAAKSANPFARLAGDVGSTRGDTHIEIVAAEGKVPLTSGFAMAKYGQAKVAGDLSHFLREASALRYTGTFGSRWAWLPVPLFTLSAAFALWLVFGASLTLVRHGRPPALVVEARRWPLRARRFGFELREVRGVEIGPRPASSALVHRNAPHLVLRLVNGEQVQLALATPGRVDGIAARMNAFLAPPA